MDLTKEQEYALVPLGGALAPRGDLSYTLDLVGTKAYGGRPHKKFRSEQVTVCVEKGVLRFTTRAVEVQDFIWNLVFKRAGKGNPAGEYVDVYVDAWHKGRKVATASLNGHISSCNNIGPKHGFVIEVQARSDIKVEHYG